MFFDIWVKIDENTQISYLVEVQSPSKISKNSWEDEILMISAAFQTHLPTCVAFLFTFIHIAMDA